MRLDKVVREVFLVCQRLFVGHLHLLLEPIHLLESPGCLVRNLPVVFVNLLYSSQVGFPLKLCMTEKVFMLLREALKQLLQVVCLYLVEHAGFCSHSLGVAFFAEKRVGLADGVALAVFNGSFAAFPFELDLAPVDEEEALGDVALVVDEVLPVPLVAVGEFNQPPDEVQFVAVAQELDSLDQLAKLVVHEFVVQVRRE